MLRAQRTEKPTMMGFGLQFLFEMYDQQKGFHTHTHTHTFMYIRTCHNSNNKRIVNCRKQRSTYSCRAA